jgi:hypothetical protein
MNKLTPFSFFLFTASILLSGFTILPDTDETEILGVWIRKGDHLMIQVEQENQVQLSSHIVEEGSEKFPCKVSHLPIYKNITRISGRLWKCDFLVVTMGSCTTDYEEGIIQIMKNGDMEITCPGFEKKVYTKLRPRYEN